MFLKWVSGLLLFIATIHSSSVFAYPNFDDDESYCPAGSAPSCEGKDFDEACEDVDYETGEKYIGHCWGVPLTAGGFCLCTQNKSLTRSYGFTEPHP